MQKFSLFLLLCGLVLCLAACGPKETTPDDDIVGDDWRTWGTIQDTGTLTRGGDSTDVCICVSDDGAKLYYDLPEQELYGSVVFPESRRLLSGHGFHRPGRRRQQRHADDLQRRRPVPDVCVVLERGQRPVYGHAGGVRRSL